MSSLKHLDLVGVDGAIAVVCELRVGGHTKFSSKSIGWVHFDRDRVVIDRLSHSLGPALANIALAFALQVAADLNEKNPLHDCDQKQKCLSCIDQFAFSCFKGIATGALRSVSEVVVLENLFVF